MAEIDDGSAPPARPALELFALGFLTLFLELVLIRYLSGSIWNLGYFPNFVLIAAFIGMGTGFLVHRYVDGDRSSTVFVGAALLLFVLVVFVSAFHPVIPGFQDFEGEIGGELFFTSISDAQRGGGGYGGFVAWFLAVVLVFAAISQRTAKLFGAFRPLHAYTLDIAGSCTGIVLFMVVCGFELPAWSWFLLLAGPFLLAARQNRIGQVALVLPLVACAAVSAWQDTQLLSFPAYRGPLEVQWSPYQKLEYIAPPGQKPFIFVNGLGHQEMLDAERLKGSFYFDPWDQREKRGLAPYERVLVIGAGSGNDVATALLHGAEHIDAVEIDPAIARFGKRHHPLSPYDDPRVSLTIDDGRAFMVRSDDRYDLIIYALTDSLVKVSAMTQLRLENFIFTDRSVERAFELLADDGDLVFYNYYRQDWLVNRLLEMMRRGSGHEPRVVATEGDLAVLAVSKLDPPAAPPDTTLQYPTDSWPFLYLKERGVPRLYAIAMATMALVVGLLMTLVHKTSRARHDHPLGLKLTFLFMGVAFLLLETKSVVQFSLLFGTTWKNTSLVFLGILLLVLAANWTAQVVRTPRAVPFVFAALMAACLVPLFVPLGSLLGIESWVTRFVVASLLTFAPIFFANLLFSLVFRDQAAAEQLFGWNLVGATLGGVVEYSSMALGYPMLAVLVAVFYVLAFASLRASGTIGTTTATAS